MTKVIKAIVTKGRYQGEIVRISNISADEMGRQRAACSLPNGTRVNIYVSELNVLEDEKPFEPEGKFAKTASMPFISGSSSSRTLTQTKNMSKLKRENKSLIPPKHVNFVRCETCGEEYNLEERKGKPGKITDCENCALETENKVEGKMIFSHKTGATIEIKKNGELRHEADTFDPKNKT